jgi:putative transcriptional regulator
MSKKIEKKHKGPTMLGMTILEVVHDMAKGLHEAGGIDAVTMREFDALCLPTVK